jgi:hypothetical protein
VFFFYLEYVAIMLGSSHLSSFLCSAVDGGLDIEASVWKERNEFVAKKYHDIRYENITMKLRSGMPASYATRWN